jgi:hypothetical protein
MVGLSFQTGGHFYLLLVIQSSRYKITRSFFCVILEIQATKNKGLNQNGMFDSFQKQELDNTWYQHGIWH